MVRLWANRTKANVATFAADPENPGALGKLVGLLTRLPDLNPFN